MATLTNSDFAYIRNWVRSQPDIKLEFNGWTLEKDVWKAAFQTVEDYMVNGFATQPTTSIRGAIEAVTGATTAARAQALFATYVAWKLASYLGVI